MFKYPSPWQVLCSNLEKREQVFENGKDESPLITTLVEENTNEQYVTDSKPFHIQTLIECQTSVQTAPTFQEIVPEEEGANVIDSQTTVTSESTMDRVTRRVFSSSSTKSINGSQLDLSSDERQDVMISPPDRRLKVLREEERFEIRTHLPETSPTKLFIDSDGDEDDKVRPKSRELTPEKVLELEKNRRDIIKKQGQRKSLDTEDTISISIKNGGSASDIDLTGVEGDQNKPNINTEQIHFESARQQFLKFEKERNSLPITPRPQPRPFRPNSSSLHENYVAPKEMEDQEGKPSKGDRILNREISKNKNTSLLSEQLYKTLHMENGEEEKLEQNIKKENESNPSDETPIEREIRLTLQREESLRKQRGIPSSGETKEIIKISINPVHVDSSYMAQSEERKIRPLTSLYIKKEIEKEVQREADLQSQGRVPGLYDKGSSQELDERRKLFEQPDEILVQPQGNSTKMITKEATYSIKEDTPQVDLVTDTTNWTDVDSAQPYSVRMKWKPAPFNVYRNRRLSADNILDIKTPLTKSSEKESVEEDIVLRKENFNVQPLKFRLHSQDNGEDERDQKRGRQEKYNSKLRPSLSNIIEQEIQQALERDRELQEERRKNGLPPLTIHTDNEQNTPQNGYDLHGSSSVTSNVSNTRTPAPWKGTLGSNSTTHENSTLPIFKQQEYLKFQVSEKQDSDGDKLKKHEKYAGIEQSDSVNTEIVESTRVNRHKNTMALRWEAGLYANEQSN